MRYLRFTPAVLVALFLIATAHAQLMLGGVPLPFASTASAGITVVNLGHGNSGGSSSSLIPALSAGAPAQSVVVVSCNIQASSGSVTVSSIQDSVNGSVYAQAIGEDSGSVGTDAEIWWAKIANPLTTASTITCNFSSTNFTSGIVSAGVVTNLASGTVDKTAGATGTTQTSLASGNTATLTLANEAVFGGAMQSSGTGTTESSGYTSLNTGGSFGQSFGYKITSATTAVSYAPTANSPGTHWSSVVATFK